MNSKLPYSQPLSVHGVEDAREEEAQTLIGTTGRRPSVPFSYI